MIRRWSRPLQRTIILALGWWLSICSAAPPDLQSYGTAALLEVEYFSWEAFRHLPSPCAKEVQAFYIDYAYRAYEAGAIDKTAYNRALALAFTRVCILTERGADTEELILERLDTSDRLEAALHEFDVSCRRQTAIHGAGQCFEPVPPVCAVIVKHLVALYVCPVLSGGQFKKAKP